MMYNTGEYDLYLEIPTDDFVIKNFFHRDIEYMEKYLNTFSIPTKNSLIILLGIFHCIEERHFWVDPLNDFCSKIDNPVYVFTGRLNSSTIYQLPEIKFSLSRISIFDHISNYHWYKRIENQERDWKKDTEIDRAHKFYWASSKDWYTRRYVLSGLIQNNLIENNLINYKCINSNIPGPWMEHRIFDHDKEIILDDCKLIQHLVPLPSLDKTIEFTETNVNFYLNSYLGIIVDTFFEQGIFFSEKVFNAINYQQIFFYIGPNDSLKYLKNIGYHTFDDIINTEYDSIEDTGKRLIAARKSLIEFLNQPLHIIKSAYQKSIPGIKHNKNLLSQQRPDIMLTNMLKTKIYEH